MKGENFSSGVKNLLRLIMEYIDEKETEKRDRQRLARITKEIEERARDVLNAAFAEYVAGVLINEGDLDYKDFDFESNIDSEKADGNSDGLDYLRELFAQRADCLAVARRADC